MSRVKRLQADRTNQKLYFARLACVQAEQTENIQQAQANQESAVFHLHGAVLALYQELARYYAIQTDAPTLANLKALLLERGQVSPELVLIEQSIQNGFIGDLNRAYQMCQYAPAPMALEAEEEEPSGMIIKVVQSLEPWLPEVKTLRAWHKELTQLIEGFRDEMVEF